MTTEARNKEVQKPQTNCAEKQNKQSFRKYIG